MKHFSNLGDQRQQQFCVHCGGSTETRDHAPSKILVDKPYPNNMPVVPSCAHCNEGFSLDEEYTACFIECVVCGSTDPELLSRSKISKALRESASLRALIERSKRETPTLGGKTILHWQPQDERIRRVVGKLSRCHTAFELNEPRLEEPDHSLIIPLVSMTKEQRDHFESVPNTGLWPEVGSRAMQRLIIADDAYSEGWVTVQEGRYRYMATGAGNLMVRGVLSEYLAYEVIWH